MNRILDFVGSVVALTGVLVCLVAGVVRLSGSFYVFGFEAQTLFLGGIALMVMACLAKLQRMRAS
jgi:hypothetical protein